MTATLLDKLRTADRATADRFFAETPAEELVAAVAAADDDQLLQLIGQEEVRAAAVPGILRRMEEYADADRLAAVSGMVRFDLRRNGRLLESHAIRLDRGTVGLVVDPEAAAGADVVLTTSLLRFVRLVSASATRGWSTSAAGSTSRATRCWRSPSGRCSACRATPAPRSTRPPWTPTRWREPWARRAPTTCVA